MCMHSTANQVETRSHPVITHYGTVGYDRNLP